MSNGLGTTEDQDLLRHLVRNTSPTKQYTGPAVEADMVPDVLSVDSISEIGRKKLDDYTAQSPYRFNQDVQSHMLTSPTNPSELKTWEDRITRTSGRDLAKDAARQTWETLPADTGEQTKNLFVGIVQQEVAKLNLPSTTEWFQRSIGTPEGESNLVAEFQDYVVKNPSASEDLKQWYQDVGLIELSPSLTTAQDATPIPTFLDQKAEDFARALRQEFESNGPSPIRSFIRSYLDSNKLTTSSGSGLEHRLDVLRHINNHFSKYSDRDQITTNELRSVRANVIGSLEQYGDEDTNYYLVSVNPSELNAIKNTGALKDLSADDFMQALLVTPQEVTDINNISNLQRKWTNAGLNAQQQIGLKYALLHGSNATTSGTVYQMAKDGNEKAAAEQRVYDWLDQEEERRTRSGLPWPPSSPLVLPSNLHNEHITSEFLILNGIKPLSEKNFLRKGLSWIYDKGKAGFSGLIAADEKVIDEIAINAYNDPSMAIGRGVEWDPFKEQTRRMTFPGTSLPFIGRLIPTHKEINKSIEDARKNGASESTINGMKMAQAMTYAERAVSDTAYSYVEGTWDNIRGKIDAVFNKVNPFRDVDVKSAIPTIEQIGWTTQRLAEYIPGWQTALDKYPELKEHGPLASYETVRLSMLREDSRPKGTIRTNLTNIYMAANDEEKREMEDAISALFEYDVDINKRWYLANAEEFSNLVINKNYSIQEALDESLTLGARMRAGFAYGNFNLLDVFGGAAMKPVKAGAMGLKRTPRIMDTMGTSQLLNTLKGAPSALNISNKAQTEQLISEIDASIMAGQRTIDIILDEATTVPVSRLRTSLFKGKESITRNIKLVDSEGTVNFKKILMPFKQVDDEFLTPLSKTFLPNTTDRGRFLQHLTGQLTVTADQIPDAVKAQQAIDALTDAKWAIMDGVARNVDTVDLSKLTKLDEGLYNFWAFEDAGLSLKNTFKVSNVLLKQQALSSLDPNDVDNAWGRHELSEAKGIKPIRALTWMFRNDGEGSVRDRSLRATRTTMNEFTQMFATKQSEFNRTASMLHPQTVKDILSELQRAAKKGTPFDNLIAMQNTIGMPVLYKNTQKALDVLKDIDLSKIKSFDPKNGPDADAGRSIEAWWAGLNEELKVAINEVTDARYGLSKELGSSLALQNGINSFVSKLFLERPAFAMRNWVTNKTLMVLDGLSPHDIFANSDAYHKEVWGEVEGAAQSFSNAAVGDRIGASGVPIRGQAMAMKVAFGGTNEKVQSAKGIKKALRWAKGGGITFIGGGLPGFFARDLSAYAEATDRFKVTDKAGHRWYRHLMGEPQIEMWFRQEHPDAYDLLKDPSNGPIWQEILNHTKNPSNVTIDNVIRLTQAASGGYVADVSASIDSLLIDMGFHGPHMKDLDLDVFKQQLLTDFALHPSSPLDPARVLEKAVDSLIRERMAHGRMLAAEAGLNLNRNANPYSVPIRHFSDELAARKRRIPSASFSSGNRAGELDNIKQNIPSSSPQYSNGFDEWIAQNYPEYENITSEEITAVGRDKGLFINKEDYNKIFYMNDGSQLILQANYPRQSNSKVHLMLKKGDRFDDPFQETTEDMSALAQRERSRVARMLETEEVVDPFLPASNRLTISTYLDTKATPNTKNYSASMGDWGPEGQSMTLPPPGSFYVNGIPNRELDLFTNLTLLYDRVFDKVKRLYADVDEFADYGEQGFVLTDEQIKSASDIAQDVAIAVSKPLRYLEQEIMMTLRQVDDPSVYKENQYGWIREMFGRPFVRELPLNIYKRKQDIGGTLGVTDYTRVDTGRTLDPLTTDPDTLQKEVDLEALRWAEGDGIPIKVGPFDNTNYDSYAQKSIDDRVGLGSFDQAQDGQYIHKEVLPDTLYHVTDQADVLLGSAQNPTPDKIIRAQTNDTFYNNVPITTTSGSRNIARNPIGVGLTDNKLLAENILTSNIRTQEIAKATSNEALRKLLAKYLQEDLKKAKLNKTELSNILTISRARNELGKEYNRELPDFLNRFIARTMPEYMGDLSKSYGREPATTEDLLGRNPWFFERAGSPIRDELDDLEVMKLWDDINSNGDYGDGVTSLIQYGNDLPARFYNKKDADLPVNAGINTAARTQVYGELRDSEIINSADGSHLDAFLNKWKRKAKLSKRDEELFDIMKAGIDTEQGRAERYYRVWKDGGRRATFVPAEASEVSDFFFNRIVPALAQGARETLELHYKAQLIENYFIARETLGQTIRGMRKNIPQFSTSLKSEQEWADILRTSRAGFLNDKVFKSNIGTNVADSLDESYDLKNVIETPADYATDNPLYELVNPRIIPAMAFQSDEWVSIGHQRAAYMRDRQTGKRAFELLEVPKENIPDDVAIQAIKKGGLREHLVYSDIPLALPTNRNNPWERDLVVVRQLSTTSELAPFMNKKFINPLTKDVIENFREKFPVQYELLRRFMQGNRSKAKNGWNRIEDGVEKGIFLSMFDESLSTVTGSNAAAHTQQTGRAFFDHEVFHTRENMETFVTKYDSDNGIPKNGILIENRDGTSDVFIPFSRNIIFDDTRKAYLDIEKTRKIINKRFQMIEALVGKETNAIAKVMDWARAREHISVRTPEDFGELIGEGNLLTMESAGSLGYEPIPGELTDIDHFNEFIYELDAFSELQRAILQIYDPARLFQRTEDGVKSSYIKSTVPMNSKDRARVNEFFSTRIPYFRQNVDYLTSTEHSELWKKAPFATAGEVGDISFMPPTINDDYFASLADYGENLTWEKIEELIVQATPQKPTRPEYLVLEPSRRDFGPNTKGMMDPKTGRPDYESNYSWDVINAREAVAKLREEAIKTHRRLDDSSADLDTRINGLHNRLETRMEDYERVVEKAKTTIQVRKPEEVPAVVQGILRESILDILHTLQDPGILNAETLLTDYPLARYKWVFKPADVNRALNTLIEEGKFFSYKADKRFKEGKRAVNRYAVVEPTDANGNLVGIKGLSESTKLDLMSKEDYDLWKDILLISLQHLADQATINRLNNPQLRRDIDELAQYIDKAQQDAIDYAIRIPEEFLTLTDESADRFTNIRRSAGRIFAKGKGRNINNTIHNNLNEFFHAPFYEVTNEQGQKTGKIAKGLVHDIENSTKEDGDVVNGLNYIYEQLGLDTRPILHEDPRRGQFLENSVSEAERLGMHTFSNQGQHAFESWLANNGPSISFLKRLQSQIQREMDPTDAKYAHGSVESYVNRMNDYTTALHDQWRGMRLVTELDEEYLVNLSDHLQSVRKAKPFATMEALPSQGVNYKGLPQFNTWSDFKKHNFLEVEEYEVGLEAITGNAASQSDLTFAIPTQRVVIGEGLTKDPSKARTMSPAMIAMTNGMKYPPELEPVLSPLWRMNKGQVDWFLPAAGKRKKPFFFKGTEAVLPVNYGEPPARRLDGTWLPHVPPLGTQGRVVHQIAPEGYMTVITNDSWIPIKGNRLAVFVRKGASEEEIIEGVRRLTKYRDDTKSAAKSIGWEYRHISRGTQNWTGYQASWQAQDKAYAERQMQAVLDEIESLTGDTTKPKYTRFMKKFSSPAEAEAERGIRRRSLQSLAYYMQEQWEKGWPVFGNPNTKREEILEVFINEQRIFEKERAEVIRRSEMFLPEDARGAGPGELGVSPTWSSPSDASLRPAPSSYSLFEGGLLRNKFSDMDNYKQGFINDGDANKIINALNDFQKISNDRRRLASKLAQAQGDWILHDYNNTNNMDYLVRWIGPWHIWQTRTTAKLAATLVENPHLLNRFTQLQETFREINREADTPTWAQMDLPLGQMAQPFFGMSKAAGIDPGGWVSSLEQLSEGSTMNIDAFLFWNDMFDYYPQSGSPVREGEDPLKNFDNYGNFGRAADIYSGILQMPINPMYTTALTALGQFGENTDVLEKTIGSLTRPADVTLGATASLMGKHHKTQLIRTNRDIREIDWQYANTALNIIMTAKDSDGNLYGADPEDNPQLQEHLMAWDLWSRRKHDPILNIPLIHTTGSVAGELFGHELSEEGSVINPVTGKEANSSTLANVHSEMLKAAAHRRTIRDGTSILSGMPINVPYPKTIDPTTGQVVDAGTVVREYYDIVRRKGLNKTEKAKLYDTYFSQHPWVRNWLANKKLETDPIKITQARSMFFAGRDDIMLEYDLEMQAIPDRVSIPGPSVSADPTSLDLLGMTNRPMSNDEYFRSTAAARENKRRKIEELQIRVFNATGVNTGLAGDEYGEIHHSFGADKRSFGDPELFRSFMKENLINNESFTMLFGDNPEAGVQKITDVLDTLFKDGIYKTVKQEDVEASIEAYAQEKQKQTGQDYDAKFIDVDIFNAWQFENHLQSIKKHKLVVVPPIFSEEFRDQYTIQGTNAADWTKYYEDAERWDTAFKEADPELYKMYMTYEAMSASPESVIDKAIESVMSEAYDDINQIYALALSDPISIARAVDTVEQTWKFPTASDIKNWMAANEYGRLWREQRDYSEAQIDQRIAERLRTVEGITFADMRAGKWDEKVAKTETQLDLETPFGEQYHWKSPNGERVIFNRQTLEEFKEALKVKTQLDKLKDQDVYIKLDPTNSISHRLYYQYFIPNSDESIAMYAAIKTAQEAGQWDTANQIKAVLDSRNTTGLPLGLDASPQQTGSRNTSGFPSSGKTATNINKKYQLYDLGQHAALSAEGKNIKALITSKYYDGTQPIPADYVFEHFARNGVASNPDIVDMWESIYPNVRELYPDIDTIPAIRTLLQMTDINGIAKSDSRIATYWYIDALAALIGQATGVAIQNRRPIRTVVQNKNYTTPRAAASKVTTPSTSGAGGLPQWSEVTRHIMMVFNDDSLETELVKFFNNPSANKLTKNHERMLRAMYKTFPIGVGYTFEQWVQALRLVYQTQSLLGLSDRSSTSSAQGRNPYFQYPSSTPRMAKYRE